MSAASETASKPVAQAATARVPAKRRTRRSAASSETASPPAAAVKAPSRVRAKAAPAPLKAAPVQAKPVKPPKVRLVRDSFTMPESDFALVAVLKARAVGQGRAAKKSELLRAGLQLLNQQDPAVLLAALERLQPIKTGRPKRGD